jgi:hypothetical protein
VNVFVFVFIITEFVELCEEDGEILLVALSDLEIKPDLVGVEDVVCVFEFDVEDDMVGVFPIVMEITGERVIDVDVVDVFDAYDAETVGELVDVFEVDTDFV